MSSPKPVLSELQREDIYQLIWSKPVSQLAVELNIKAHRLARLCDELLIPRPSSGYWAARMGRFAQKGAITGTRCCRSGRSRGFQEAVLSVYASRRRRFRFNKCSWRSPQWLRKSRQGCMSCPNHEGSSAKNGSRNDGIVAMDKVVVLTCP